MTRRTARTRRNPIEPPNAATSDAPLSAYLERESGEVSGAFYRQEQRVRRIGDAEFGIIRERISRHSPYASILQEPGRWLVERRYGRRYADGRLEMGPWELLDLYRTRDEALLAGDSGLVPVDPRLAELVAAQETRYREMEAARAAKALESDERARRASKARASAAAFTRLRARGGKDAELADAYNALVAAWGDKANRIATARQDPTFFSAYMAVQDADNVNAKRRALRAFLAAARRFETIPNPARPGYEPIIVQDQYGKRWCGKCRRELEHRARWKRGPGGDDARARLPFVEWPVNRNTRPYCFGCSAPMPIPNPRRRARRNPFGDPDAPTWEFNLEYSHRRPRLGWEVSVRELPSRKQVDRFPLAASNFGDALHELDTVANESVRRGDAAMVVLKVDGKFRASVPLRGDWTHEGRRANPGRARARRRPTRRNPTLMLVTGNPAGGTKAAARAAWAHFHQREDFQGKVRHLPAIAGAPGVLFALGACDALNDGKCSGARPLVCCDPSDNSLWIVATSSAMDLRRLAGQPVHAITYDPVRSSGKERALFRHDFKRPLPKLKCLGSSGRCRAALLDGGRYSVRDWIYD